MSTLGDIWIQLFENGSFGFLLLLVLNQIIYFILLSSKSKRPEKYKFAVDNEVKYLKRTANLFSAAIFFFLFSKISISLIPFLHFQITSDKRIINQMPAFALYVRSL